MCWRDWRYLAERIPEFAQFRPKETVAEIARMLRRELDFGREERNLDPIRHCSLRTNRPCGFRSRSPNYAHLAF